MDFPAVSIAHTTFTKLQHMILQVRFIFYVRITENKKNHLLKTPAITTDCLLYFSMTWKVLLVMPQVTESIVSLHF